MRSTPADLDPGVRRPSRKGRKHGEKYVADSRHTIVSRSARKYPRLTCLVLGNRQRSVTELEQRSLRCRNEMAGVSDIYPRASLYLVEPPGCVVPDGSGKH